MLILALLMSLLLTGCAAPAEAPAPSPPPSAVLPSAIAVDENGVPALEVNVAADETIAPMDIETYLLGVVAGEMKNDWPLEALKAQAILARTFVLRFVSEKESRYAGADISTDIAEAQAYNAAAVNEHVRQAVEETRGLVLVAADGSLPYTWFHAHSGGRTALAREALGWRHAEPSHTKITDGLDSPDAPPEAVSWEASFPADVFLAACRQVGADPQSVAPISILEKGGSGRAVALDVNGERVPAAELRIALGSTDMRSTLLTALSTDGETVRMAGRGYGHGVGMPQWGAYALAQDGLSGEDIALHYYRDLSIVKMW